MQIILRIFLRGIFGLGVAFAAALYPLCNNEGWFFAMALLIAGAFGWEIPKKGPVIINKTISSTQLLKNKKKAGTARPPADKNNHTARRRK